MDAKLEHVILNVSDPSKSFPFYKDLFGYFRYKTIVDDVDHVAFRKNGTPDFWFVATDSKYVSNGFHRKNTGINHFAFHVSSQQEIDEFADKFLKSRNIPPLYSSPKLFPEYTPDYYAVFFEDPDRLKIEVASFTSQY